MAKKSGNLNLGKPKQTQTVMPKKDTMASNVGGNAHMSAGDKVNSKKNVKVSWQGKK